MFESTSTVTFEEVPELPPLPGITFGQSTHPGRVRENNEDHHDAAPEIGFFVVADGVGGGPAGGVAAHLATAAMVHAVRAGWMKTGGTAAGLSDAPGREPLGAAEMHGPRLFAAALLAHKMICDFAARNRCRGAATTMAALWLAGDHVHVANAGDSRVYRLCADGLEQLTKDHTALQECIDRYGALAEGWRQRLGHVVTQVLGGKRERLPEVHLTSRPLSRPEVFLLCTDGLTNMVEESEIASVLRSAPSPQRAADELTRLADEAGGLDNITCVVVRIEP